MVDPDGMMSSPASSSISAPLVAKIVLSPLSRLFFRAQLVVRLATRTILYACPLRSSPCSSHSSGWSSTWWSSNCLWEITTTHPCLLLRPELLLLCRIRLKLAGSWCETNQLALDANMFVRLCIARVFLTYFNILSMCTARGGRGHEENYNDAGFHFECFHDFMRLILSWKSTKSNEWLCLSSNVKTPIEPSQAAFVWRYD